MEMWQTPVEEVTALATIHWKRDRRYRAGWKRRIIYGQHRQNEVVRSVPSTRTRAAVPAVRREGAIAIAATAVGALALGAVAVGALAIGKMAIGQLALGRTKVRRGDVNDLVIARLTIRELTVERLR